MKPAPSTSSPDLAQWCRPERYAALLMMRSKRQWTPADGRRAETARCLGQAASGLGGSLNRRATLYYLQNDYSHSLQDIQQVLIREPRHFGALAGLGMIMQDLGDNKRALDAFRRRSRSIRTWTRCRSWSGP